MARLRYSPLPETVAIFPSALLDSALTKMRAAANDALVERTLHPPKIPRKPAAAGQSAGSSASGSGQASSSGARRLLPLQASLARRGRTVRVRLPFPLPLEAPAAPEERVKAPEKSLPDGTTLPVRVGGCLALHWRRWQAIGAETWVVTVLWDGYRVPSKNSPPPLSRTPISFPTYRAGSPRAQALWQEVEAMLAKGALEIARDPGPRSSRGSSQTCQRGHTLTGSDFSATWTTGWFLPPRSAKLSSQSSRSSRFVAPSGL